MSIRASFARLKSCFGLRKNNFDQKTRRGYQTYLVILAAGILTYCLFRYCRYAAWVAPVNSDSLYLEALFQDLIVANSGIGGWSLPPAPYFFPDAILYFFLRGIGLPIQSAWSAHATFLLSIVCLGIVRIHKSLRIAYDPIVLFLAMSCTILTLFTPFLGIISTHFLVTPSFHGSTGAIAVALFPLLIELTLTETRFRLAKLCLLSLICSLTTLSDALFFAVGILPLIVSILLFHLVKSMPDLRRLRSNLLLSLLLVAVGVIGAIALREIAWFVNVDLPKSIPSLKSLLFLETGWRQSVTMFINSLSQIAAEMGLFLAIIFLSNIFLLINGHPKERVIAVLGISSFFSAFISSVLLGKFTEFAAIRYIIPSFFLMLLPLTITYKIFIQKLLPNPLTTSRKSGVLFGAASALFLVFAGSVLVLVDNKIAFFRSEKIKSAEVRSCITTAMRRFNRTSAIGDYWDAKWITFGFSPKTIQVDQVDNCIYPFHWISNISWLRATNRPDYTMHDSIIVRKQGSLDPAQIIAQLGIQPIAEISCDKHNILFYPRGYDLIKLARQSMTPRGIACNATLEVNLLRNKL